MIRHRRRRAPSAPKRKRLSRNLRSEPLERRILFNADTWGDESIVNVPTVGDQISAPQGQSTALLADGSGWVAYSGNGPGDSKGVFVRGVDNAGVPSGDPIRVNQTRGGIQKYASIATAADGTAIVSWTGRGADDQFGIHARRIAADGTFLSDEFRVNETSWGIQSHPVIASLENGNFVIAWAGFGDGDWVGVFARQFDPSGHAIAGELRVNPNRFGIQGAPQVAALPGGGYAVAWSGTGSDDSYGVYVRRYNADTTPLSGVTRVNPSPSGFQGRPDLAVLPDGQLLVAWSGRGAGDASGVYVRQLGTNHQPSSQAILVNLTTTGLQYGPSIATSNDGSFLVLWNEIGTVGFDVEVKGRHFQSITNPSPDEFTLPATVSGQQYMPSVAGEGNGGYLASWTRQNDGKKDVYVRRLARAGDTNPPAISLQLANDTGTSSTDRTTSDLSLAATIADASPVDAVALSVVETGMNPVDVSVFYDSSTGELSISDAQLRSVAADPIVDGQVTIRLLATDAFGNASSDSLVVTLDTTGPLSPVIVSITDDTGSDASDFVTSDNTLVVSGSGEANSTIRLLESGFDLLGTATTAIDGSWSVDLQDDVLADGIYSLSATATDSAGNKSFESTPVTVEIDTLPPDLPLFDFGLEVTIDGNGDFVTTEENVSISGTTDPGAEVTVVRSGLTTVSAADGTYSIASVALAEGTNTVLVRATDTAGNGSEFSEEVTRQAADVISLTESAGSLYSEVTKLIELGQDAGSRVLRMRIDAIFDSSANFTLEDTFLVSLVDPNATDTTLLDRGENGTTLFMLSGSQANFPAGLVQYDGQYLEIDLTSLADFTEGLLVFQLVSTDADLGSQISINDISSTVDPRGTQRLSVNFDRPLRLPGGPTDLAGLTVNEDIRASLQNLHLDVDDKKYLADIRIQNFAELVSSDAVVVFRGLPSGVSVTGASGLDAAGDPYLSFSDIIDPIGLDTGVVTDRIRLEISNPALQPFPLHADVLTRSLSSDPITFDSVDDIAVAAGGFSRVSLSAADPDARDVLYSLVTDGPTPTITFDSAGEFIVRPQPSEAGVYELGLVASVGSKSTRQDITLTVAADTTPLTSISGRVLDVDGTPLRGIPVVLGRVSATTDASGRFTIDLPQSLLPTEEFDITVPAGDVFFDPFDTGQETIDFRRARYDTTTGTDTLNPRQHPNLVTGFLDASVLYGSEDARATALRTLSGGRLKTQMGVDGELLPFNSTNFFPDAPLENDSAGPVDPSSLFVAGDVRGSENPMLASLHTVLVREHNRLADEIAATDPSLDDEAIFQRARKMVGAIVQHITYNEYLPLLLGENSLAPYSGYNSSADPSVDAFFTTVAFRIGHSQTPDHFDILTSSGEQVFGAPLAGQHASFNTDPLVQHGLAPILRGMLQQPIQEVDLQVSDSLRNMLFGPPGSGGLDLPSLSIQRARDLGLPSYNQARIDFGLAPVTSFEEISSNPENVSRLAAAYHSVDQVDAFVGGLAEDHVAGAMVGPLFHAAIKSRFEDSRASDRFWYENGQFTASDLSTIRATTIAALLERNSGLNGLTGNLFSTTGNPAGPGPRGTSTNDSTAEFRAIDGSGNNLADPQAGATGSWLRRDTMQYYADGISEANGANRPSARAISNAALDQTESSLATNGANTLSLFWGQLIAHDFSLTPTGTSDTLRFLGDEATVPGASYPYVAEKLDALIGRDLYEGMNNEIERPIFLPKLDLANADPINPMGDTIVDTDVIPGLKVVIPAASTTTREGDAFTGSFSVTEVPRDLAPISLPESMRPDLLMTIQPAELTFDEPVAVTIPNRGASPPGSFSDLVAINPNTGQFEVVGRMQVSEDGSVLETIQGGLRTTNWFLSNNDPTVDGAESEANNDDACACEGETQQTSSEVQLFTGALLEKHTTSSYQSLGKARSLTLVYDSMRADPRHIVRFGANRNFGALQPILGARLEFSSGTQTIIPPQEELLSAGGVSLVGSFWESEAVDADLGVLVDFSNLPTDVWDWNVDLGLFDLQNGQWSGNWNSNATSGRVVHVNGIASPFGAGWTLENWSRVVETGSGDALVVRGDGTQILFRRQADGSYQAPPIVFDTLTKETDGRFQLRTKSQTVYQFGDHGQQTTMTDRVGNQTTFAYDANGMLQSYEDEARLITNFLYNAAGDRISQIVDPAGRVTFLEHDANGNLGKITDPDNAQRMFLWNSRRNMTGEIDQLGRIERTIYGPEGRVAASVQKTGETVYVNPVQPRGIKSLLAARSTNYQSGVTALPDRSESRYQPIARFADRNGRLTEKWLTPIGFLTDGVDDLGATGRVVRNSQNLVAQVIDADGHFDRYEYDDLGNVTSIRDALDGGNRVDGQIDTPGQQQHYSFTITDETTLLLDPVTPDPVFTWSLDGPQGTLVDAQSFDVGIFDSSEPGIRVIPGEYLLTVDALEGFTGNFTFRLFDVSAAPTLPLGVESVITFDADNPTAIYQLDVKPGQDYFIEVEDINHAPEIEIVGLQGRTATSGPGRYLSLTERFQNALQPPLAISFGCPFDPDLLGEGETKPPQSFPIIVHEVDDQVRSLALGEAAETTLDAPTETATYEFEVESNARVSFAVPMQSEGIQATLRGPRGAIFDTEAERIDAGQFGFVADFGSRDVHLEPGRYALEIAGVELGKPSFAVTLADAGPDQTSVFSGGPAFGDASLIGLDQRVTGPIDGSGQTQFFDFTLTRREVIFVSGDSDLPGLQWSLEGPGFSVHEDRDGNPLTLHSSFAGNDSSKAYALERGDYRFALTPTTTSVGSFEFTLVALASTPLISHTGANVVLGGDTQAVALMLQVEAGQSWTVDVNRISGIDPDDAVIRIIDSTGRDVSPTRFWSAENQVHDSTYDGELYLLIGSRARIPSDSSVTLAASPLAPRLLTTNLNETASETLTAASPLNVHAFTMDEETLVAIDFDRGSPDIEWALYDARGQVIEAEFFENIGGGPVGGPIGGGGIGGGGLVGGMGGEPVTDPQPFALLPSGDYTLEVSQFGFDTVDYSLTITDVATAGLLVSAQSEILTLTDTSRSAYRGIILEENQEVVVEISQPAGLSSQTSLQLVNPSGNHVAFYPFDGSPQQIKVDQAGRYTVVVDSGTYLDPVAATPSLTVSIVTDNSTPLPLGSLQTGTTESPYQTASFSFDGVAGQVVLLQRLQAAAPTADLTLLGPGGNPIVSSNAASQFTEPVILTRDGTYRVQAGGNGTRGEFRFRVLNLSAANLLSAGLPRTQRLSESAASLAYRIPASVGQRVRVSLDSGSDTLIRRRVFSASGVLLADSAGGTDTFTANHAGDFYVVVDAPGASTGNDLSFAIVADDLTAPSVTDSGYDRPFGGTITPGSIDEYSFTASAGVAVRLRKTDFDSSVLQIELSSPSGQAIDLSKVLAFPESGTYTLRVQGILANDMADYELSLDRIDQLAADGVFANRRSGTIRRGEAVVQRLTLTAGQGIAVDGGGDATSSSAIRIYDPNLNLLFDGHGDDDFLFSTPVSGTYFLVVDSATATATDYSFRLLNLSDATNIVPGLPIATALNDGNDFEAFRFSAASGQRLYADGGISNFESWTLYDPFMNEIFSRPADVPGGLGEFELELDSSGNYTLVFDSSRTMPQTFTFVAYLTDVLEPIEINPYASGSGMTITYDPVYNVPTEIVDELGRTTRFVIDPDNGNVLSTTRIFGDDDATFGQSDDLTTTYTYTTFGLVDTVTDPLGRITDYDYDADGNVIQTTYASGTADASTMSYEYDSAGNVSAMVDAVGNRTEYEYDEMNRLLVVRNALLDETRFTYDARGNRLTYTNERGHRWTYDYDQLDRLTRITDPLSQVQRYTYDDIGNVIRYVDQLGRVTRFEYDSRDRLIAQTAADGGVTKWTYDGNGNIAAITDPLGRFSQYFYDARDQRIAMIDADGNRMTYRYDSVGNLVSVTDPLGRITRNRYDELDRLTQVDFFAPDIVGHTTTLQYDKANNLVETTDPLGRITNNVFDNRDRLVSETRAVGTIDASNTSYEYDPEGNIVAKIDANGNRSQYDYDPINRIEVQRDALNQEMRYRYDPAGNVIAVTDRRGFVTEYEFDALNRPVRTTDALTHEWTTQYDAVDNIVTLTDPLERQDEFTYDALNRLLTKTDSAGNVTTRTYDLAGNVRGITDARTNITTYDYDPLDRVSAIRDADGDLTTFHHDGVSNLLETTDALGRITQYDYDGLDRVIQQRWLTGSATGGPGGADEDVTVTSYAYDIMGNLLSLTDGLGNQTTWTYDNLDRQLTMTDPLSRTESFTYDPLGLVTEVTDRGGYVTIYEYDVLNRLETETWLNGHAAYGGTDDFVITYGYDADSNLTSITDPLSSLTFTIDALHRIETENNAGTPGVPQVELTFVYDEIGNRTSITEKIGGAVGAVTAYSYDDADRVRLITQSLAPGGVLGTVSEKRVDFTYNPVNQFDSITRYGDLTDTHPVITTTHAYDTLNRLQDLRHAGAVGNDLAFYAFDYDEEDRLTQIVDIRGTIDYGYDGRGQLTHADYPDARSDEAYDFDQNGNRLQSGRHSDSYQTGPNNRLLSDGRYTYDYNDRGDMVLRTDTQTGETREFTWDHRGRLASVDDLTDLGIISQTVSYTYDGLDRRITRSFDADGAGVGGATTEAFVYDGEDVLLDFVDGDLAVRYLHGPAVDQVLAREDFTQTNTGQVDDIFWHLHDQLGSTREIADSSGTIVDQITLDAFGYVVDQTDSGVGTRYLFTGREYDEATGQYYYRARYYDPAIGRFISEDPIGFQGGDPNLYRYVDNQTTTQIDPFGLINFGRSGSVIQAGVFGIGRGLRNAGESVAGLINTAGEAVALTVTHHYANVSDGLEILTGLELAGSDAARQRSIDLYHENFAATDRAFRDFLALPGSKQRDLLAKIVGDFYHASEQSLYDIVDKILDGCWEDLAGGLGETIGEIIPELLAGKGLGRIRKVTDLDLPTTKTPGPQRVVPEHEITRGIGRSRDLDTPGVLDDNEWPLRFHIVREPNGSIDPRLTWKNNSSALRKTMRQNRPIRDVSNLKDRRGQFLNAERNLLENRGWEYDANSGFWLPPAK